MIRVNLLGVPKSKRRRVRAPMVLVAPGGALILGVLLGILVLVAGVQWWRYNALQSESVQLNQKIQALQREKAELAQVQAQYETFSKRKDLLTARINIIEQLKSQQSGPVALLDTLASSVSASDAVWLTNFNKTGDKVSINGVALNMKAVADLITRLMSTGTFKELDLKQVQQDTAHEYESFNFTLEAQLAGAAPSAQTAPPGAA